MPSPSVFEVRSKDSDERRHLKHGRVPANRRFRKPGIRARQRTKYENAALSTGGAALRLLKILQET